MHRLGYVIFSYRLKSTCLVHWHLKSLQGKQQKLQRDPLSNNRSPQNDLTGSECIYLNQDCY